MTKTNLAVEIRDAIERDIATGGIDPGSRLDEVSLCSRFGVSRTPVREALRQLVASGMLEMHPNRGCFVRKMDVTELIEMFEVMAELEAFCCRLAARRVSEQQLDQLQQLNEACVAAQQQGDPDGYYYANEKFHRYIYELSGNAFLAEQARQLSLKLRPYRRLQLRIRNRIAASSQEHAEILEALRSADAETSASRMKSHILVQGEKFSDLASQLRQRQADQQ